MDQYPFSSPLLCENKWKELHLLKTNHSIKTTKIDFKQGLEKHQPEDNPMIIKAISKVALKCMKLRHRNLAIKNLARS